MLPIWWSSDVGGREWHDRIPVDFLLAGLLCCSDFRVADVRFEQDRLCADIAGSKWLSPCAIRDGFSDHAITPTANDERAYDDGKRDTKEEYEGC
jgi:hypothetical protein